MENIIKSIQGLAGGKILDVATGQGEFIALLKAQLPSYQSIIGIDDSENIIEYDKTNYEDDKIEFQLMDAYKMSFPDDSFDIVTISNSLHHFAQPLQILAEMKRVTKPGGKIIIHEMISDDLIPAQLSHKKIHHWSAKIDMLNNRFHAETYTKEALVKLAKKQLDDVQVMSYDYPIEDNKDKELIEKMKGYFEMILKRAEGFPGFAELEKEAEDIKQHIDEHGYEPATFIYMIAEKK